MSALCLGCDSETEMARLCCLCLFLLLEEDVSQAVSSTCVTTRLSRCGERMFSGKSVKDDKPGSENSNDDNMFFVEL